MEEPWSRLHDAATLASAQRSVMHCKHQVIFREQIWKLLDQKVYHGKCTLFSWPQVSNDSLDFQLKSVYDHHKDFFWSKNQILYQKETVSEENRWVFVTLRSWTANTASLCQQWHFRYLIHLWWFTGVFFVLKQETGNLKAGKAGKGTRERDQSVGWPTEVLHLQH